MSSSNPENSKSEHKRQRQDWGIVLLILLIGFLCVIVAGQQAMIFAPRWALDANVESNIDLNSEFLTSQPAGYFEPLDPAILTQPGWASVFLTPGAPIPVGTSVAASVPTGTTVSEPTATLLVTNTLPVIYTSTAVPTNTLVWLPLPATNTPKPKNPPPADTPTDTPIPLPPNADLVVTIANTIASYSPGTTTTYTIQVTNNGPDDITGATVTDNFNAPINGFGPGGSCTPVGLGASCGTWAGSGNINDTVNLPASTSVIYTVPVTTDFWSLMNLANQASVSAAGYMEATPGNETATDTDTLVVNPAGDIGSSPNCNGDPGTTCFVNIPAGGSLTLNTSITIPHPGPDLIYYERPNGLGTGIWMDWVILQVSDGTSSYQIFYWGDGSVDSNTNLAPLGLPETDDRVILFGNLYGVPPNQTGIVIDLDVLGIPPGTYTYLRIYAPPGDIDGSCGVDAIEVLP